MQIIVEPIDAVELKVLTSQTHTYKLDTPDENLGDMRWLFVYFSL